MKCSINLIASRVYICLFVFFISVNFSLAGISVDGKLDETIWNKCKTAVGIVDLKHAERFANYPATLKAWRNADALYIAAYMPHPDVTTIKCEAKNRDQDSWEDESLELFIVPDMSNDDLYYHISVNADGVIFDQKGSAGPASWDCEGIEAATKRSREEGSWTLEVKIPLAGICGKNSKPNNGQEWGFNFVRTVRVLDKTVEISSWSKLDLGAHEPFYFGRIKWTNGPMQFVRKQASFIPEDSPSVLTRINGGFEYGLDGWSPMNWVGGGNYGDGEFAIGITDQTAMAEKALLITAKNISKTGPEASRGGAVSREVELTPGRYVLRGYYKFKLDGEPINASYLASVYASGGGREISLKATQGWRRFECEFELKKVTKVKVLLRLWANGEICFDEIDIVPFEDIAKSEVADLITTSKTVNGRKFKITQYPLDEISDAVATQVKEDGCVAYQRKIEIIQADSIPADTEVLNKFSFLGSRGEELSDFFMLYFDKDREDVAISIVPDKSAKQSIDPEWITISRIPFWLQRTSYEAYEAKWSAEVLFPMKRGERFSVKADSTSVFAMNFKLPRKLAAGAYKGQMQILPTKVKLPIELVVGDFELDAPAAGYGLWVGNEQQPGVFKMLKDGGVDFACIALPFDISKKKDSKGGVKVVLDCTKGIKRLKDYQAMGMKFPIPVELTRLSTNLARALGIYDEIPHDPTHDSADLICPQSDEEYPEVLKVAFKSAILQIHDQLSEEGFADKVLYYPVDEPSSNPHRMFKAKFEGGTIKKLLPDTKVYMTTHDIVRTRRLGSVMDVGSVSLGVLGADKSWSKRFHQMAEDIGLEVWCYTGSTNEDYSYTRGTGFKLANQNVSRLMLWMSYFGAANTADPLNDLQNHLKCCATFYPVVQGSTAAYYSTIQWEGVKQAVIDLRYLATARSVIKRMAEKDSASAEKLQMELDRKVRQLAEGGKITKKGCDELRSYLFNLIVNHR